MVSPLALFATLAAVMCEIAVQTDQATFVKKEPDTLGPRSILSQAIRLPGTKFRFAKLPVLSNIDVLVLTRPSLMRRSFVVVQIFWSRQYTLQ